MVAIVSAHCIEKRVAGLQQFTALAVTRPLEAFALMINRLETPGAGRESASLCRCERLGRPPSGSPERPKTTPLGLHVGFGVIAGADPKAL